MYRPLQPLASGLDSDFGGILNYIYAQKAMGKLYHLEQPNDVTLAEYLSGSTGKTIIATSLEKDPSLQLSSISCNNSRVLNISLQMDALAESVVFLTYLEYDGICKAFLNNASAKE